MKTIATDRLPILIVLLGACTAGANEGGGGQATSSGPSPDAVLSVTIADAGGTALGTFAVAAEDVEGRPPGISRVGDFTSVTMVLMGTGTAIGTATLKTRSPGPGSVTLDDQGETDDALRLVFFVPGGPDGVSGQYESTAGSATLTAVEEGRVAGTFEGTFEQQHGGGPHRVTGSFDFRRSY